MPMKLRRLLLLRLCHASVSLLQAYDILSSNYDEAEPESAFLRVSSSIFLLLRLL